MANQEQQVLLWEVGMKKEALIFINKNQSNERSLHTVKVKRINYQVTTDGYNIDEPEPGTTDVNKLDTNIDTCCLGENFTVLQMTLRNANVYPYNFYTSPSTTCQLCQVPLLSRTKITVHLFIMLVKEVLYYSKKLDHSLINPNQLICYGKMVWDNPFDQNRDLCL